MKWARPQGGGLSPRLVEVGFREGSGRGDLKGFEVAVTPRLVLSGLGP